VRPDWGTEVFDFQNYWPWPFRTRQRILFVADVSVNVSPGGFSVARVSELIDGLSRGCVDFDVTVAQRGAGFRFTPELLRNYDQVWIFAFNGAAPDADEIAALSSWMDNGGGVFATGDHSTLGEALGSAIPRVRHMRAWTTADDVPPQGGLTRHDTLTPSGVGQFVGIGGEGDQTPQVVEPVFRRSRVRRFEHVWPHEVLCHPTLGVIDVMPDHMHEGRTFSREEVRRRAGAQADFGIADGEPLWPEEICHGRTIASPPATKATPVDSARFEMITVYDGHAADEGHGRVVVDSTWHHWFDMNLVGLEAAADQTPWLKVSRYFENVAAWLSRPKTSWCEILGQLNNYPLIELIPELDAGLPFGDVGTAMFDQLRADIGPCATLRVINDICDVSPGLCNAIAEFNRRLPDDPFGPMCLSCPPPGFFEGLILEAAARSVMDHFADVDGRSAIPLDEDGYFVAEESVLNDTFPDRFDGHLTNILAEAATIQLRDLSRMSEAWEGLL